MFFFLSLAFRRGPRPCRRRRRLVAAVGSTAARANGASRWPFSVALAGGADAAWPFGAALQRSFPTAVAAAGAAIAAAVTAAAIAAAANATLPLLCPIADRHITVLASLPAPPPLKVGPPAASVGSRCVAPLATAAAPCPPFARAAAPRSPR